MESDELSGIKGREKWLMRSLASNRNHLCPLPGFQKGKKLLGSSFGVENGNSVTITSCIFFLVQSFVTVKGLVYKLVSY